MEKLNENETFRKYFEHVIIFVFRGTRSADDLFMSSRDRLTERHWLRGSNNFKVIYLGIIALEIDTLRLIIISKFSFVNEDWLG